MFTNMGTESQSPASPIEKAGHGCMLLIPNMAKYRQENSRIYFTEQPGKLKP